MNRTLFASLCVLAGCVVGAALPTIRAQSYASDPAAQRWEQFCENVGAMGTAGEARARVVERMNASLRAHGERGFELVNAPVGTFGKSTSGSGSVWAEMLLCFKRPTGR